MKLLIPFITLSILLTSCKETHTPTKKWSVATEGVFSASLSTDAEKLLIGSYTHGASYWNTKKHQRMYNWNHAKGLFTPIFYSVLSKNQLIALTADNRDFAVWNTQNGESIGFWSASDDIIDIDIDEHGRLGAISTKNHKVTVFDLQHGKIISQFVLPGLFGFSGQQFRIRAFFSEPASYASLSAFFMVAGLQFHKKKLIIFSLLAVLFTSSPTNVLAVILASFGWLFSKYFVQSQWKGKTRLSILFAITVGSIVVLIILNDSFLEKHFPHQYGRTKIGVMALFEVANGEVITPRSNIRAWMAKRFMDYYIDKGYVFTGLGPYSHEIYGYENANPPSLLFMILSDFGVFGVLVFIYISIKVYLRLSKTKDPMMVIYLPFFMTSMINYTQGMIVYQYVFMVFFYVFLNKYKLSFNPTTTIK